MKLAFLFPGQGSQCVGMGADLYSHVKAAKSALDDCDTILAYKLTTLCFYGPEEKLRQTNITQPALFAVSVAAWKAIAEAGLTPSATAGHSVGEYAALAAAGAMDLQTGLSLTAQRGELMRQAAAAHPGSMAAVIGLSAAQVREACAWATAEGAYVDVANLNGAGQIVISGEALGVEKATAALKERGARKVIGLAVSGAFHSRLMEPAVESMRAFLDRALIQDAAIPVIANVDAEYETDAARIRENLALQIASTVRWEETLDRLLRDGFDTFVELGSGKVLTNILRRVSKDIAAFNVEDAASLGAAVEQIKARA